MAQVEKKTGLSERIYQLREKVLNARPTVCTERARFYTEMYQQHEARPVIVKRALALEETLKRMTIFIDDGELIVGNQSSQLRAAPIFPEYAVEWVIKELDEFEKRPGDTFFLTEDTKEELRRICSYWQGKTTLAKGRALMNDTLREIHATGIIRAEGNLTSGDAHIAANFEKILKLGIQGYLDKVEFKRKQLDLTDWADLKKEQFYQAVIIGLKAMQDFITRFAELALSMSKQEEEAARKAELERISENCRQIAQYPPEDFYQALQLTYFIQLILQIESNGHSLSLGRLDQYLYPFYKQDKQEGKLSDAFVMELLENVWIKLLSINKIRSWSHTRYSAGSPLYQNVTIGGQTVNGEDAVNELSYLILWSVGETKLTQPNLSVRYHKHINEDFMLECVKVIEKGFGMPAFNNDEIVIPAFLKLGVEKEDTYNYSAIGCIEVAVPGKWGYRCTGMHFINFMRVFLAALHDGKDTMSGKTFCPGIGNLTDFDSFDDVLKAWRKQIAFYAKAGVAIDTAVDSVLEEQVPDVLCSAFVDNCIRTGKTIKEGGSKYDFISGLQVGIANLGNSLAAIKKLVFEEQKISQDELMTHLEQNFEGKEGEKIRQILLNYAPKYGNDENYVDILLREAYMDFIHELKKYHTTRYGRGPIGCYYYAGTSSISANVPSGSVVPATPDGRKAYTPLAEGSSPSSGTDTLGPTAVFKSVTKLPTNKILGGVLLNQKLSPAAIQRESDKKKLLAMMHTFFTDLKGWHVQYNIINRETLLDAKAHPENYRDLIVRVAGYSAFFTNLSPDAQDDIIARTEHVL
ncbi:formate C-acetyltransferase/glycerol dehydratase family glycyl radical enzyme [candidate division KSB3 bacterium]|uniref:Formate C-acetyltransferase/glycerol dehydratase family glycyl radical enzyme n=1 Tax=candidate division KSB3 bacterium TaxID=2044937 RepID=A0A2G6KJ47_9BACT|nr:MAG: formate C-acetyltransferase/glycerol dehydratase family glycyl radical enzyme [candidate division KSB3 bacterium]